MERDIGYSYKQGYSSFKTRMGYINQLLLYNYKTRFVLVIDQNKKEKK